MPEPYEFVLPDLLVRLTVISFLIAYVLLIL